MLDVLDASAVGRLPAITAGHVLDVVLPANGGQPHGGPLMGS